MGYAATSAAMDGEWRPEHTRALGQTVGQVALIYGASNVRVYYKITPCRLHVKWTGVGGKFSPWDIMRDPSLTRLPAFARGNPPGLAASAGRQGWVRGLLRRGTAGRARGGYKLNKLARDGVNTAQEMIQFHPGGGHHGPIGYWKVSSGAGITRFRVNSVLPSDMIVDMIVGGTGGQGLVEDELPAYLTDNQGGPLDATIHWTEDGFIIRAQKSTGESHSESVHTSTILRRDIQAAGSALDYQPLDWRKPGLGVVPHITP